ncbi:hypothetical protein NEFER03_0623 [Nematocida sp. LUAm3]|nr:hypothetical protein NEFER03_0623 [Nematocida sp. LUAm3]KAI5175590.1 hypothetical protein NEFER02_1496 [Nematocida sp. LUAm2]KAI5178380.1 hypothetical protein NEFER01_1527 [Nematocida sp. LUAm1]
MKIFFRGISSLILLYGVLGLYNSTTRINQNDIGRRGYVGEKAFSDVMNKKGLRNNIERCPVGFSCVPLNYPPTTKRKAIQKNQNKSSATIGNKYTPLASPKDFSAYQESVCLNLDKYDYVYLYSKQNRQYLGNSTERSFTKDINIAKVFASFGNRSARWRFEKNNGACVLKNLSVNRYMTICDKCASNLQVPLISSISNTVDDKKNTERWIVNLKTDGSIVIESLARQNNFLGICANCLSGAASLSDPVGLFDTSRDNPIVAWEVHIDKNVASRNHIRRKSPR